MSDEELLESYWRRYWWIYVIPVVLTAVIAPLFILLGDDPEDVVEDYLSAVVDRDCAKVEDLMSTAAFKAVHRSREECESAPDLPDDSDVEVEVGDSEESDDQATVEATVTAGDIVLKSRFVLDEQDGDWQIVEVASLD